LRSAALKRLASAVRFRPWPPQNQQLTGPSTSGFVPFCSNNLIQARSGTPPEWNETADDCSGTARPPAPKPSPRVRDADEFSMGPTQPQNGEPARESIRVVTVEVHWVRSQPMQEAGSSGRRLLTGVPGDGSSLPRPKTRVEVDKSYSSDLSPPWAETMIPVRCAGYVRVSAAPRDGTIYFPRAICQ
jgi:hypothetical protein